MRITPYQLRAARSMVNLTQGELADLAGVSPDTVADFEADVKTPHKRTVEALWRVLDGKGVELIGARGVALRDDFLTTIEGDTCYLQFLDLLYQSVRGKEATVLFFCVDDSRSHPEVVEANNRLRAVARCRYVCEHGAPRLDYPPKDYRAIPSRYFRNGLQVIYLDRVATFANEQHKVLIVRNATLADTQRALFELVWNTYPVPGSERDAASQ